MQCMLQICVSKIDKKYIYIYILRGINFTNLKTSGGYIAKLKPQGISLQMTKILGGDYAI